MKMIFMMEAVAVSVVWKFEVESGAEKYLLAMYLVYPPKEKELQWTPSPLH